LGHDGPFHSAIAEGKPILRGMGLYHGKQGSGVSVEAKVRSGPVTTLNVTQTGDGKLKLISSEGESTRGPIMQIGNTQTPVKFRTHPDDYMAQWFAEAPPITAPCRSGIMPPCSRKLVRCWKLSTLPYKAQLETAERKSPGFPGDFRSFPRGTLRYGPCIVCLTHPPSKFVIARCAWLRGIPSE